ncbi:MAG: polyprenyl synthetase family protein [Pirellulales bacterium]
MHQVTSATAIGGLDVFAPVRAELGQVEARLASELNSHWPEVDEILQYGCLLGGKRLRPALLLLTAQAAGGVRPNHILLATVIEMIHTATLVHDDVLDEAQMRRHLPTVNARWGIQTSVLLGDYLFTHAFYLASTTGSAWACREIGQATNKVCEGELQQTHSQGRWDLTEDEYYAIVDGKTAALTECACRLAAQLSELPTETVDQLARYGRHLGRAFQIVDDLLDLEGEEPQVGKSLGTDLQHGKVTLPWIFCRQQLNGPELREFQVAWETGDHGRLMGWLRASGGVEASRRVAQQLVESAIDDLQGLPPSRSRDALRQLAEFVVVRSH